MSGSLCPQAHYVRPIMSARAHYVHGPISGASLTLSQGACGNAWKKKNTAHAIASAENTTAFTNQSVPSLRSSVIESFIFLLESRWKFLVTECLNCVRFSLNDIQSQVPSFDLNNDVFDLKFSPLIAKFFFFDIHIVILFSASYKLVLSSAMFLKIHPHILLTFVAIVCGCMQ